MEFQSQVGQDKWVCEMFNYKRNGYFIDIGAYDGIHLSNTYYLEKELGWTGICVEPDEADFKKLVKSRDCECVNTAIYSENTTVEFVSEGLTRGMRLHYQGNITPGNEKLVKTITMQALMADRDIPDVIDYVSIDTEGSEHNVLFGFPFDKYQVLIWTIEHNAYLDGGKLKIKIRDIMTRNGYSIVPTKPEVDVFEDWFIHEKMAS